MRGDQEAPTAFEAAALHEDAETVYQQAPCGYLSTLPDGTIVKVNDTLLGWLGCERDELVGRKRFSHLLSAGGRIYHDTHYAPMLRMGEQVREMAFEVVRVDGTRLPVLVNASTVMDPAGKPLLTRVVLFAATQRRQYERELLLAKRRAEESEARARALALTLQQTLIPPGPPEVPGLLVEAGYRPAGDGAEVGGDFYDVFEIGTDDWVVTLGDVCGKGAEAAVVTALVRHTLRAVTVRRSGPAEALEALNEVLLGHPSQRFCTVVVLRARRRGERWEVTLSLGGHPQPLLVPRDAPPAFVGAGGSVVGALAEARFAETEVVLDEGDRLLLYTDGVTEARSNGIFYGDRRLLQVAHEARGASLVERVLGDVVAFQGGLPRDDVALVSLRPTTGNASGERGSAGPVRV